MRIRTWVLRLLEFGGVQAGVQLLNAISGLIIVHALPKPEYAFFVIANSMQVACNLLADLGIGIGARSIGGRVWNDPVRFGSLLNAAIRLRNEFAVPSFCICLSVTAWMLWVNQAPWWTIVALSGAVLVAVLPLLASSVLSAALQLHGKYRRMQKIDFGSAALRFVMVGVLTVTWVNAALLTMVVAVTHWLQLVFLRRWTHQVAHLGASPSADDRREIMLLSLKALPNTVFFCFQAQITLIILTFLGTTTSIADFTALGRLSALFAVVSVTFASVVAPRFARCQDPDRLARLYVLLVVAMASLLVPLAAASWVIPEPFLWLLGEKYALLGAECGWVVTTGCVAQLLGVMWGLNSSKAWIRFHVSGYIAVTVICQVAAVSFLDLRQFRDVLVFNFVTALAPLPLYIVDAFFGLRAARNISYAR